MFFRNAPAATHARHQRGWAVNDNGASGVQRNQTVGYDQGCCVAGILRVDQSDTTTMPSDNGVPAGQSTPVSGSIHRATGSPLTTAAAARVRSVGVASTRHPASRPTRSIAVTSSASDAEVMMACAPMDSATRCARASAPPTCPDKHAYGVASGVVHANHRRVLRLASQHRGQQTHGGANGQEDHQLAMVREQVLDHRTQGQVVIPMPFVGGGRIPAGSPFQV